MEFVQTVIDIFLHVDEHLNVIILNYGAWTYALLFMIIFMETGFVVTPFLPGDSLLFAAGTFAALGSLKIMFLFLLLFVAAVLGDTINYWIGNRVGPPVFERNYRFLKQEHLERTQAFYDRHGGKTIVLARFVPIVRTFAPFVAGVGTMPYGRFLTYNVFGAFIWTGIFLFLGYFFGNIPVVRNNFELVIPAIILISVLPMIVEYGRSRSRKRHRTTEGTL
ncbi:MAG: DedA family protein [Candidatus Promineifilaceae bacterium]|nr:DedA family protein [Candidatus Promineifilaceae bacterium]